MEGGRLLLGEIHVNEQDEIDFLPACIMCLFAYLLREKTCHCTRKRTIPDCMGLCLLKTRNDAERHDIIHVRERPEGPDKEYMTGIADTPRYLIKSTPIAPQTAAFESMR